MFASQYGPAMDLRTHIKTPEQIERFKAIIASTDFMYQPFVLSDDLEVGGGYEFVFNRIGAGFVHWANGGPPPNAPIRDRLISPDILSDFRIANIALRAQYDGWCDSIARQAEASGAQSVCDFGCFNGYIPVGLALRGIKRAVGYDQDDRGACIAALNEVLGTNAEFHQIGYNLETGVIAGEQFDIVSCMSVLQHIPEPLRFINMLAAMTKQTLYLMTNVWDDDDLVVRYGEPNTVWGHRFPWCFDNSCYLSKKMLLRALELAGFSCTEVSFDMPQWVFERVAEFNSQQAQQAQQAQPVAASLPEQTEVEPEQTKLAGGKLSGITLICQRVGPPVDMARPHKLVRA
ncbi:MAG: methyltransferase domain-containing protein [Terricaulis sp.]